MKEFFYPFENGYNSITHSGFQALMIYSLYKPAMCEYTDEQFRSEKGTDENFGSGALEYFLIHSGIFPAQPDKMTEHTLACHRVQVGVTRECIVYDCTIKIVVDTDAPKKLVCIARIR